MTLKNWLFIGIAILLLGVLIIYLSKTGKYGIFKNPNQNASNIGYTIVGIGIVVMAIFAYGYKLQNT